MSLPDAHERRQLDQVAHILTEVLAERGHRVDVALEVDPAFGSTGTSRKALTRELVVAAVSQAASQVGLDFRSIKGDGRELRGRHHGYRVLRASRDADGELIVPVSSDSALAVVDVDIDRVADGHQMALLPPMKPWALLWIPDENDLGIAEVLAAEVLRTQHGRPGRLVLGTVLALGSQDDPNGGGFIPTDEDLDLDLDDENGEGGLGGLGA